MKNLAIALLLGLTAPLAMAAPPDSTHGPTAALNFELRYKGDCCNPGVLHCYPQAQGVPLSDCVNIIPMTESLWTPGQLTADFRRRMSLLPARDRKKGIIVMLKTERCATKISRACTITTAALEKRSTPLVAQFLVYGVQLKPRDHDDPPGSRPIETGADAWKNLAAGEYRFQQGPGATLVFLNSSNGAKVGTTNAAEMNLLEWTFLKNRGRTPELHRMLQEVLLKIDDAKDVSRQRSKIMG